MHPFGEVWGALGCSFGEALEALGGPFGRVLEPGKSIW